LGVKQTLLQLISMSAFDPKRTLAVVDSGSLSSFVHWSFVTPDIFRIRVVMVPDPARLEVLPMADCSGFAGRLSGAFCFQGGDVSVVGTKHISSPLERDNAWLRVQLTGRLSKARVPMPRPDGKACGIRHIAKSPPLDSGLQHLGDMPWVSRATAIWPDARDVASDHANVKTDTISDCRLRLSSP
jgi:hypothetical protein